MLQAEARNASIWTYAMSIKPRIQVEGKAEVSRFISLLSLGVCSALEEGVFSPEEAHAYLFNPITLATLKALGVPKKVLDSIIMGGELPDIKNFIPDALPASIRHMETRALKILQSLPKTTLSNAKKWFVGVKRQSKAPHKRPSP